MRRARGTQALLFVGPTADRRARGAVVARGRPVPGIEVAACARAVALIEAMVIGVGRSIFSANQQVGEEEGEELSFKELAITFAMAMLLTVGLFVVLPAFIIRLIQDMVTHNVVLNFVEGVIKIAFFTLYIVAIVCMEDIKRVFQYHGAEHKAINCTRPTCR